jgi:hypothetical protein
LENFIEISFRFFLRQKTKLFRGNIVLQFGKLSLISGQEAELLMPSLSQQPSSEAGEDLETCADEDGVPEGRFGHELRVKRNNCPLCSFVQKEMEKGNSIPVEEWIYLAHLRNAHGVEP